MPSRTRLVTVTALLTATRTVSGRSAEFRKTKKNNWKSVGAAAPSNEEQAAADAILASAAAENASRQVEDEEAPTVADDSSAMKMQSGAGAGLQSAAQVEAAISRRKEQERKALEAEMGKMSGKGQETIYRDASGRMINVAMKRAEARRAEEERWRKEGERAEAAKGDVQRVEKEKRRKDLEEAKYMKVARYADDVDLNEELREREHWNDPAAAFLSARKAGKSVTGKPLYKGAAPPNRYGIRPGYRWDGVDRSTGFEKEYFAARNKRQNMRELEYAWQMDE